MSDTVADPYGSVDQDICEFPGQHRSGIVGALRRLDGYDVAILAGLAGLAVLAFLTFGSYAISNDEVVQHRYGQLILDYYRSGLTDLSVFNFENLYLYGGLFDIVAVSLSKIVPMDAYDLRHIMCALIGISGIGATAATARLIAGPRVGFLAGVALALCGAWYGGMFNHTKDIPLAAAMAGATYFLVRLSRGSCASAATSSCDRASRCYPRC